MHIPARLDPRKQPVREGATVTGPPGAPMTVNGAAPKLHTPATNNLRFGKHEGRVTTTNTSENRAPNVVPHIGEVGQSQSNSHLAACLGREICR